MLLALVTLGSRLWPRWRSLPVPMPVPVLLE
jgi:hypothetical protein